MVLKLTIALLEDSKRFKSVSELLENERSAGTGVPGFVATGDGRTLYFTRRSEALIGEISRELKLEAPLLAKSHTDEEWRWSVRRALGPAMAQTEDTHDSEADARMVIAKLRQELSKAYVSDDLAVGFGLTLFSNFLVARFQVGPVRIEPREQWLTGARVAQHISAVTERRTRKHWKGEKIEPRRPSADSASERDLIDGVGDCQYVCAVSTGGLASNFAKKKAIVAAHLALVTICLTWDQPSHALRGIRLSVDAPPLHQTFLRMQGEHTVFADRQRVDLPHAPYVNRLEWKSIFDRQAALRSAAGEVIAGYLSTDSDPADPNVLTALFHALLWFYEGCKENNDHIAIVKLCAAMDALSGQRKEHGILDFLKARSNLQSNQAIFPGQQTLKGLLREIYKRRSTSIHGNSIVNRSDVSTIRIKSEKLARLCLIEALHWLSTHDGAADPRVMQSP